MKSWNDAISGKRVLIQRWSCLDDGIIEDMLEEIILPEGYLKFKTSGWQDMKNWILLKILT